MRFLGYLIVLCLLLSILRYAILVLCLAFAIMLLWGILTRPREAFAAVGFGVLLGFLQSHPGAAITIVLVLLLAERLSVRRTAESDIHLLVDRSAAGGAVEVVQS
jgi:hypothetical protein